MKNIIYAKCINIVMHKTHHRRRRNRTRRGGVKTAHAASAASAPAAAARSPELQAILDRVKALAAQAQAQGQSIKPSRRSGISKSQAAKNRFKGIMEGKVSHSTTQPVSKHGSHNRPGAGEQ
jgi:hypothetical protein